MQNVTEILQSIPTIVIAICYYINRRKYQHQVWADFRVPKVYHICCNIGTCALPDMYAISPRAYI